MPANIGTCALQNLEGHTLVAYMTGNIFLSSQRAIKVGDFGLSKKLSA